MRFFIHLIFCIFLSECILANDEPRILEFQKDPEIEGEFFGVAKETSKELKKILKKDFFKIGKTVDKFPFIGIQATYLVCSKKMPLVLTMIKPLPESRKGMYFHISKVKFIDGKYYQFSDAPDYGYLRIFIDEDLWSELDSATK